MRLTLPTHSATTLELGGKNLELALAFASEGQMPTLLLPAPGILSDPTSEGSEEEVYAPFQAVLGAFASPVASLASFLLFQRIPALLKAAPAQAQEWKLSFHPGAGRPQAFLPGCSGILLRAILFRVILQEEGTRLTAVPCPTQLTTPEVNACSATFPGKKYDLLFTYRSPFK